MSYLKDKLFLPSPSPTVPQEAWRKALMDAAEYIRAHGLWKGGEPTSDKKCIVLAVAAQRANPDVLDKLKAALGVRSLPEVYRWNDAPERTAAEVVAALAAAARS